MGTLRLLLALSIVVGHVSKGLVWNYHEWLEIFPYIHPGALNGGFKVNIFFIIAGFYTMLLVKEKHHDGNIFAFYVNRLFRLMPVYWLLLTAIILCSYFLNPPLSAWRGLADTLRNGESGAIFTHLFQNYILWSPGLLSWTPVDFSNPQYQLIIRAAWALSADVMIIIVAPWFLYRTWSFILLIVISTLVYYHYASHLMVRDYVGACQFYFVIGCIGYVVYDRLYRNVCEKWYLVLSGYVVVTIFALIIYYFGYIIQRIHPYMAFTLIIGFASLAIPYLAATTRKQKWDRFLGELAYPIYLSHGLLFNLLYWYQLRLGIIEFVMLQIVIAAALHLSIDYPIGKWRRKRLYAEHARVTGS